MNVPPPSPEDHNEGNAIYVNRPRFYSLVLGTTRNDVAGNELPGLNKSTKFNRERPGNIVVENELYGESGGQFKLNSWDRE